MFAVAALFAVAVAVPVVASADELPSESPPICWPASQDGVTGEVCQTFTPGTTTTITSPTTTSSTTTTSTTTVPTTTTLSTTSTTTTTTLPPQLACIGPQHTPGGPDGRGGCWPGPHNTGVPEGTILTAYTGPCTITAANTTIQNTVITCGSLWIQASGVTIRNTRITGRIRNDANGYTMTDSEVHGGASMTTSVVEADYSTLTRIEVTGGPRGILCESDCTVRDSWVHAQQIIGAQHASGIRQSQGALLVHNTIQCDVGSNGEGGGCSAPLVGYGDWEPVMNNRLEANLFVATPAGYCSYGGSSGQDGSKPYGNQAAGIVFVDNVFQRGPTGKCGLYGVVASFNVTRPGNQWTNNRYDDGTIVDCISQGLTQGSCLAAVVQATPNIPPVEEG